MKLFRLLPLAALACLTVSCDGGSGTLSESSTPTDSLMYYVGQLNAGEYWRDSNNDTTLREASQKEAYLAGVRAGLNLMKDGDETYNRGLMAGLQMANQVIQFSESYEVTLDKNMYVRSLSNAILADTMPNSREAQHNIGLIIRSIEQQKSEKDKALSQESLQQVATKDNLPKLTDDLYGKVTVKTDSAAFVKNDNVDIKLQLAKENGETINLPLPTKGRVGNERSFPMVISDALLKLKSGETGEFLTTAHALFGPTAKQRGFEPTEVIKMTLSASIAPAAEGDKPEANLPKVEVKKEEPKADAAKAEAPKADTKKADKKK